MVRMSASHEATASASDLAVDLLLFLCSFAPLFLILTVRFRDVWLEIICGGLFVSGLGGGLLIVWRYRGVSGRSWTATRAEDRGGEVAGYLASYILPFVVIPEPGWRDLVGYAIFLAVAATIYIRSGMLQINPTLYLLGWRVFAVTVGDDWNGFAISRRSLAAGDTVEVRRVSDRVFLTGSERDAA
jgi:hypothetical protein